MSTRDIVRQLYAAAAGGDTEGFFGAMADDIVIHEPGFLPYGGTYSGKDQAMALVGKLAATFDLSTLKAEYIVAAEDRSFAVLRIGFAESTESMLVAEEAVVRHGKVAELRVFVHDGGPLVPQTVPSDSKVGS